MYVNLTPQSTGGSLLTGARAYARWKWLAGGLAVLFLITYPLLNGQDAFGLNLLTETLIFALFALSLDLLLGYTGLVSFGHATYFGLGAYSAGILTAQLKNSNFLLGLLMGVLVAGLGALVLGFFSIRTSGIYFLMLTLAFSQMCYALAFKWNDVTGGSNGLPVPKPEFSLVGWQLDLGDGTVFYFVVLTCFLAGFFGLRQVVHSPFGRTLIGIRDNEKRLAALGYQTSNFKLMACVIAGALGGLAGALNAYHNGFVSANEFYWTTSGLVMVMVLLGGKGSLIGAVLGAFFVRYAEQFIQGQQTAKLGTFVVSERWQMVLGLIFILCVLLAPGGLVGLWQSLVRQVTRRLEWR
ncbi:MAG: branched-chain amino acid ABC transporter permease [Chloroflexi bacterium]|nr:branched-chain amino acid ABC transporter permease [Chloroflexota bacterium]